MEQSLGTPYRRSSWETWYYAAVAAVWIGMAVFSLLRHGLTSGWFFVAGGVFAYGAVQSTRLPYAVVGAEAFTVWISPLNSKTIAWRDIISARRVGQRVRVELPRRKHLDVRCDGVILEERERFRREFAAHLDSRWRDDPRDTQVDTLRQVVLVAVLAVVFTGILAHQAGLIDVPALLP